MQYFETQCPLCNASAKYNYCDQDLWKYFNCSYCKRFFLHELAEELLESTAKAIKLNISKDSHNNSDKEKILVIEINPQKPVLDMEFRYRNLMPRC